MEHLTNLIGERTTSLNNSFWRQGSQVTALHMVTDISEASNILWPILFDNEC